VTLVRCWRGMHRSRMTQSSLVPRSKRNFFICFPGPRQYRLWQNYGFPLRAQTKSLVSEVRGIMDTVTMSGAEEESNDTTDETEGNATRFFGKCQGVSLTRKRRLACPPPSAQANGVEVGPRGRRSFPLR
jgi:hypothetical protein